MSERNEYTPNKTLTELCNFNSTGPITAHTFTTDGRGSLIAHNSQQSGDSVLTYLKHRIKAVELLHTMYASGPIRSIFNNSKTRQHVFVCGVGYRDKSGETGGIEIHYPNENNLQEWINLPPGNDGASVVDVCIDTSVPDRMIYGLTDTHKLFEVPFGYPNNSTLQAYEKLFVPPVHTALAPDGTVAFHYKTGKIDILRPTAGSLELVRSIPTEQGIPHALTFGKNGRMFASAGSYWGNNGYVRINDPEDLTITYTPALLDKPVNAVCYAEQQRLYAAMEGQIVSIEVDEYNRQLHIDDPIDSGFPAIDSFSYSPITRRLSASCQNEIKVWQSV